MTLIIKHALRPLRSVIDPLSFTVHYHEGLDATLKDVFDSQVSIQMLATHEFFPVNCFSDSRFRADWSEWVSSQSSIAGRNFWKDPVDLKVYY